jgi:trigger factor
MAANVENLGTLERRVSMRLPVQDIEKQVDARLKQLARNVKMPGFRPGKVPMKIVAQTYGPQVRNEVLGDAVQKSFSDAVKEANLRVAGYPKIEKKEEQPTDATSGDVLEFSATFEVYPEVKPGDVSTAAIEHPKVVVDDAAVARTLEVLRKQRTKFIAANRPAQDGDRLTVDFHGTIDGVAFDGGKAENFIFALGERSMLPEFEAAARGMSAGDARTFSLRFPDDYHGKSVAGKDASFSMTLKNVDEARLPEIDADFAKSLGVADGDVDKMRAEVRANVEREVKKRIDARLKNQVMDALLAGTPLELPKALIEMEARGLLQRAAQDLQSRGVKPEQINLTPQQFEETAKRRVALGLIIGELARAESLQPKPAEVRALVEQEAQSYESPAEVVKWFYMQRDRLAEMEAMALEANVVKWVLSKAQVKERDMAFDELMGAAGS